MLWAFCVEFYLWCSDWLKVPRWLAVWNPQLLIGADEGNCSLVLIKECLAVTVWFWWRCAWVLLGSWRVVVWFWSRCAWVLFGCCSLVLIEVRLGFIWLLQFGSDRGVLGFYLAVAVWFWSRCAWVLFGCCSLVLIAVRLGFIWLLHFGSDRSVLGFYLAVAVWFWSRCVGVSVCCQFGSDRGVLGFHFAVHLAWLHGFMALWLHGFMASWACFTFIGGIILVTCYFLFLIYKFSTGGRLCALVHAL